uniref:Uncharacterized protein n=1 Tax=Clastoptera arizonana TaxID=38151 RepID=A0A1B6DYX3_9HEMI
MKKYSRDYIFLHTMKLINIQFILSILLCLQLIYTIAEDVTDKQVDERINQNKTIFEYIDRKIYTVMVEPENGTAEGLIEDIKFFTHCLRRAVAMWVDMDAPRDFGVREAGLILFNYGGPTFFRIPIDDEEVSERLKRVFKWTDKDLKYLMELQAEAELEFDRLRKAIL